MMQHHSLSNGKPSILSRRINLAGIGAVAAAAALMLSAESAHAGPKEAAALKKQLKALGTDVTNATSAQLAEAVIKAYEANTKLSPGVLSGEALKTLAGLKPGSVDAIVLALETKFTTLDAVTRQNYVGDAAKAASTGPKPNAEFVDEFTASFLKTGDALLAAQRATGKAGVGAILAGSASVQVDDPAGPNAKTALQKQIDLTNAALAVKKLSGAVLEISRGVAASASDSAQYALQVALVNPKLVSKIAPGVAAATPQNAGEIVNQLLNTSNTDLKKNLQTGIAGIAASISKVADVEQISLVGAYLAEKIGSGALGPNNKPLIPLAKAKALTTTLTKAIIAKPTTQVSAVNRADEIAEVAAYIVGGVVGETSIALNKKDAAGKFVLSIIQAAVKGGKATAKQAKAGQSADLSYVADIVASVANTVNHSSLSADLKTAIQNFLTKASNVNKIAGKSNAQNVLTALNLGFAVFDTEEPNVQNPRLEDGNSIAKAIRGAGLSQSDLDQIVDPETDKRNYLGT